ncbi:cyclin-domain-containing protein [Russula earlei]|uniref:Cyclin-domain-containing protein n=1 Tax=Russula earlei TaxID=71964 RepID=A0ACC0UE68_9AGAM|nr:cyclin-domain-containing protein [Russula earlei]
MTTLPPITSLQRQYHYRDTALPPLAALQPPQHLQVTPILVTPADASRSSLSYAANPAWGQKPPTPPPDIVPSEEHVASWFSDSRSHSSQYTAENTCEMICYLWFSQSSNLSPVNTSPSQPFIPFNPKTARLQFSVSSVFVHFMQKLLQTTQLSQSVIVLSLHYVFRLKERNSGTVAHPGSEFRVAVAALMMANKFVDDNTYTNKTWSEVSGIELNEINKMEREFLAGIDFNLYVDKETYVRWVGLLEGLVMAKERGSRQWRRSRQTPRAVTVARPVAPLTTHSKGRTWTARARSSSPVHLPRGTGSPRSLMNGNSQYSPEMRIEVESPLHSRGKRSALDAFSPASAAFNLERPAKRPISLALEIPQSSAVSVHTPSPLESLQSFSKLSLGSSPALSQCAEGTAVLASARHVPPQTLIASYRLDPTKPRPVPKHLFFYSLAGSPMAEDSRSRKGLLRYHQPPQSSAPSCHAYPPPPVPYTIQSASTSPHHSSVTLPPALSCRTIRATFRAVDVHESLPGLREAMVPLAPFANAGPPGVHYHYPTPAYSPDYHWRRGRRL